MGPSSRESIIPSAARSPAERCLRWEAQKEAGIFLRARRPNTATEVFGSKITRQEETNREILTISWTSHLIRSAEAAEGEDADVRQALPAAIAISIHDEHMITTLRTELERM